MQTHQYRKPPTTFSTENVPQGFRTSPNREDSSASLLALFVMGWMQRHHRSAESQRH